MTQKKEGFEIAKPYLDEILKRKPEAITALEIGKLTSYTDVILIITAGSARQVTSLAEHLYVSMKNQGNQALGCEGLKEGSWALLDFGDILVHVFNRETRDFYDLEGLWSDAPRIEIPDFEPSIQEDDDDDDWNFD